MTGTTVSDPSAREPARDARTDTSATEPDSADAPPPWPSSLSRRRPTELACAWCGTTITVKRAGRIPTWCSETCRHRAWEQNRAAASGRAGVTVIERVVEVERPVPVVTTVEVPALPRGPGWATAIQTLTKQLDTGRVYDRDLHAISSAVIELNNALNRRLTHSNLRRANMRADRPDPRSGGSAGRAG